MSTRALRLLAAAALLVAVAATPATAARAGPLAVGVWNPINDVSEPYIQELGKWAVSKYLSQGHVDGLLYGQVLSGEQQVVNGMNYKLALDAMDTTATVKKYRAFVFDQRTKTRELKSFEPVD